MLFELVPDITDFLFRDLSSTHWASLKFRLLEFDFASKFISLLLSLHKPIPVNTYKMKFMEASIYSNQISSISELLFSELRFILTEIF